VRKAGQGIAIFIVPSSKYMGRPNKTPSQLSWAFSCPGAVIAAFAVGQ
jgi:hypothetical protein